jgi:hypothetical protein
VRVEHALIGRHGFPGGGKLIGGRIGRILGGGGLPNLRRQAISSMRALVEVRFEPAMK